MRTPDPQERGPVPPELMPRGCSSGATPPSISTLTPAVGLHPGITFHQEDNSR